MLRTKWFLAATLYLCAAFAGTAAGGGNLIANPRIENVVETEEARKIIPEDQHRERIHFYRLRPAGIIPEDWRPYSGGGYGEWGATDKEAYSGEYSVFLSFGRLQEFEHLEEGFAANYIYSKPFEVEPGTAYDFSFMIKGDLPVVRIEGYTWSDEAMSRESRSWLTPGGLRRNDAPLRVAPDRHALRISPSAEWIRYSCIFNTGRDSKMMQIGIGYRSGEQKMEPGQTIYVDDARLTKRG